MTGLDRLAQRVAEEQDSLGDSDRDLAEVRRRLAAGGSRGRRKTSRGVRRWPIAVLAAATVLVAVGAGTLWSFRPGPRPLAFVVGPSHASGNLGQWIFARTDDVPLLFSDGTEVILAAGTRARVVDIAPTGADIVIETGKTHVDVVPTPGHRWTLSVGPFEVLVTGTRFDVSWAPDNDQFELRLYEGHVQISGCAFGDKKSVHAGEIARASCAADRYEVVGGDGAGSSRPVEAAVEEEPEKAAAPPAAEQPDRAAPAADASSWSSRRPPTRVEPDDVPGDEPQARPRWQRLLAEHRDGDAVDAAVKAGFEPICETADVRTLAALGDAARFSGRLDKARQAYLILRRRFAGRSEATVAAFRLGRMDFDQRGAYATAAQWFQAYLNEQPNGPLAQDALGRLMEALYRSGDHTQARRVAERYLASYPSGPHLRLARALVEGKRLTE